MTILSQLRLEELRSLPQHKNYQGVQDLFEILFLWIQEDTEQKNDYEYEALQDIHVIMTSQNEILQLLQGWDRSGYDFLNEEQQDQYDVLIDILVGKQKL